MHLLQSLGYTLGCVNAEENDCAIPDTHEKVPAVSETALPSPVEEETKTVGSYHIASDTEKENVSACEGDNKSTTAAESAPSVVCNSNENIASATNSTLMRPRKVKRRRKSKTGTNKKATKSREPLPSLNAGHNENFGNVQDEQITNRLEVNLVTDSPGSLEEGSEKDSLKNHSSFTDDAIVQNPVSYCDQETLVCSSESCNKDSSPVKYVSEMDSLTKDAELSSEMIADSEGGDIISGSSDITASVTDGGENESVCDHGMNQQDSICADSGTTRVSPVVNDVQPTERNCSPVPKSANSTQKEETCEDSLRATTPIVKDTKEQIELCNSDNNSVEDLAEPIIQKVELVARLFNSPVENTTQNEPVELSEPVEAPVSLSVISPIAPSESKETEQKNMLCVSESDIVEFINSGEMDDTKDSIFSEDYVSGFSVALRRMSVTFCCTLILFVFPPVLNSVFCNIYFRI